jgi:hypothetical protein
MKITFKLVFVILSIVASTQRAMALPLAFDFSFIDSFTGDSVAGIISGLNDNSTGPASSVLVTSNTGGYGLGEYIGSPAPNEWTVLEGEIIHVIFSSFGVNNTDPAVTCCSIAFSPTGLLLPEIIAGLSSHPDYMLYGDDEPNVTFTRRQPGEIPIPSVLTLLGVGLFGLGVSRRTRKLQR